VSASWTDSSRGEPDSAVTGSSLTYSISRKARGESAETGPDTGRIRPAAKWKSVLRPLTGVRPHTTLNG
jgi:hypothetical protein